jgi:hypothetical protein
VCSIADLLYRVLDSVIRDTVKIVLIDYQQQCLFGNPFFLQDSSVDKPLSSDAKPAFVGVAAIG